MCFVLISEETAIISLHSINRMVLKTDENINWRVYKYSSLVFICKWLNNNLLFKSTPCSILSTLKEITTDIILLTAAWDFPDFSVHNLFWSQQTQIDPNPQLRKL